MGREPPARPKTIDLRSLVRQIGSATFDAWFRERRTRQNVRDGTPYFNRPATVPEARRVNPSQLLSCHRKVYYRQHNAPQETPTPRGVFWVGSSLETDLMVPYLEWLAGPNRYVQNSIWVDSTVDTDLGEVTIRGETDPTIVRPDGTPLIVTEIKSVGDLGSVDAPRSHHRAQLTAYLRGLEEEWDRSIIGALIYVDRSTLDVDSYLLTADESFWVDEVLPWIVDHVGYRLDDTLPPGVPESPWECSYCPFRHRCGVSDLPHADRSPTGLLPDVDYPRERVVEYLETHDYADVPPALLDRFPELIDRFDLADWECVGCGAPYVRNGDAESARDPSSGTFGPICTSCSSRYRIPVPYRPRDDGG